MYRLSVAIWYTVGPEQPMVRERPVMPKVGRSDS
jgi:hypothetical protein